MVILVIEMMMMMMMMIMMMIMMRMMMDGRTYTAAYRDARTHLKSDIDASGLCAQAIPDFI